MGLALISISGGEKRSLETYSDSTELTGEKSSGLNFDVRIPLITFLAALVFNIYRSLVCGSSAAAGDCSLFPLNLFDPSLQVSTAGPRNPGLIAVSECGGDRRCVSASGQCCFILLDNRLG